MLDSLEPRGIGIAIVNVSCCKDENDSDLRKEVLSRHQLLGVMSMKNNLFRRSSGVIIYWFLELILNIKKKRLWPYEKMSRPI